MAIMHRRMPNPIPKGRTLADHGEPFRVVYRVTDGRGGWRWLQARAFSLEQREGQHVRWLHDTIDITEQRETEKRCAIRWTSCGS